MKKQLRNLRNTYVTKISVVNPWTRKGTHPTRVSGIEKKEAVKNILKIMDDEDDHQSAKKTKPWKFMEMMAFLDDYIDDIMFDINLPCL